MSSLFPPTDEGRKTFPIYDGLLMYFPRACASVANLSLIANEQHSPGEPMHWARGKSMDQRNTLVRHLMEAGGLDSDGVPHSTKVAWRALAALELELEAGDTNDY